MGRGICIICGLRRVLVLRGREPRFGIQHRLLALLLEKQRKEVRVFFGGGGEVDLGGIQFCMGRDTMHGRGKYGVYRKCIFRFSFERFTHTNSKTFHNDMHVRDSKASEDRCHSSLQSKAIYLLHPPLHTLLHHLTP